MELSRRRVASSAARTRARLRRRGVRSARARATNRRAGRVILPPIPDPIGSFTARWVAAGCMPSAARQGRAPARVDRLVAVHADDSTT